MASRTDRGVSARGNALVLRSELPPSALLRALNGIAPEIWFTHARPVDATFRPRAARSRWYRYYLGVPASDAGLWRPVLARFEGDVDARTFGRGLPTVAAALRPIDSVVLVPMGETLAVDLTAAGFVWGMVRKIIGAAQAAVDGALGLRDLDAAISGKRRLSVPLARPEPLVLMEVAYGEPWPGGPAPMNRHQRNHWEAARRDAQLGLELARALGDGAPDPGV